MGSLTFLLWAELLAARGEEVQSARQLRRGWGGGLPCPPEARPALISQCWGGTAAPPPARPPSTLHLAQRRWETEAGPRAAAAQLLW